VTDQSLLDRINALSHEEEALWHRAGESSGGLAAEDQERLQAIGVELDQCYDMLHQRQARREFGLDPDAARVRPAEVVERYQQ
jgi:hypothetical protein